MFGYRVPAPDEAMLISGGKRSDLTPFRVVTGHGAFVTPFIRKVQFLSLALFESEVNEPCVTRQGIALNVRAVIAFKVGNDTESIVSAGQRFLSDQDQMAALTGRIFSGHLRSIIGSMTVEEIITERQKLANEVLDGSKTDMAKIGLMVDALQIQSIDDKGLGYIAAMAAPHNAAIQQAAKIAQSAADQASAQAEQASQRQQAEYARQTAVVQAQYRAEIEQAQATAGSAGPLAAAQAQRQVLAAQTELAQRAAELRQQQLVAEVIKPAEAEAERTRILARAEAERTRIQAEAAAVEQPGGPGPDPDRAAAADRREGGLRAGRGERHRAQRRRRRRADGGRVGRAGAGHPRVGARVAERRHHRQRPQGHPGQEDARARLRRLSRRLTPPPEPADRAVMAVPTFADVSAVIPRGDGAYDIDVHRDWTIVGKPNGGYLLAMLGRAAAAEVTQSHVLAASAHYLRSPEPGPAASRDRGAAGRALGQPGAGPAASGRAGVRRSARHRGRAGRRRR